MGERERIVAKIRAMRKKLANTKHLMSRIGKILVETIREAFLLQQLGDIKWSVRYGGTLEPPFLNIAGALADFIRGSPAPKKVQFLDQPALLTTGALRSHIRARAAQHSVTVTAPDDYAKIHQEGGESVQTYDTAVKDRIRRWLYDQRYGKLTVKKGREAYEQHLAPLLKMDELRTKIEPRPFMGVTDEAEQRISAEIRKHFAGGA